MAGLDACLGAARAALAGFELQALPLAAIAGALLLVVLIRALLAQRVPSITVEPITGEAAPASPARRSTRKAAGGDASTIPCYDPGTQELLGYVPAMSADEVRGLVARAKAAGAQWRTSPFSQRRQLLKIMLKFIVENQEEICRVSAIDSGKPMVDAAFGEVIVTCEKIWWLVQQGEQYLKPETRPAGTMMFYKHARAEYVPVGVVGAIVPWNYPFHNIFNPLTAALFAGNAIVIKVSEHASWSARYYKRIIDAALAAAGAPADLVQIVTGYGEAGNALVTSPDVGKIIFVGSTQIGRKVMEAAAANLTPVVLELGGKDAFIVCDDADLDQVLPTALRGAFQSCGQNCAGAERFIVHDKVFDQFVRRAAETTAALRQGAASGEEMVDCGAMCMPGAAEKVQELIDDAVAKGATVAAGGKLPRGGAAGQFYPPTVITGVTPDMRIWQEEVFGPVMAVVKFATDDEAVAIANDCPFGLGSSVFSGSRRRARAIAACLEAGMSSLNDFATTYMCQSLPFGGVKHSGFDRFAGIEGLRGMCIPKAVAEDRWPFKTAIPPLLQYPVSDKAFSFVSSLVWMFYAPSWAGNAKGLAGLIACFLPGGGRKAAAANGKKTQ
ncbi:Aldehyde dehydrogenase 22A1 [Chlorella sorokiniana]|uniref:Aldehyde dehydrogenase 22A1 n=1 Tax=Chlorella sorokiniana TaxID=3076 RepID=A0A2P6TUJ0_CHLSO|nr:Aldehyde dehydrogenase 22A1 [Chlorella sorokiniana]|eukprot:PRW57735.1 Aldehyde dehydrogenase 22A1 [Chlorella sorokiniana]